VATILVYAGQFFICIFSAVYSTNYTQKKGYLLGTSSPENQIKN
jgi:hypothetical protein